MDKNTLIETLTKKISLDEVVDQSFATLYDFIKSEFKLGMGLNIVRSEDRFKLVSLKLECFKDENKNGELILEITFPSIELRLKGELSKYFFIDKIYNATVEKLSFSIFSLSVRIGKIFEEIINQNSNHKLH